MVSARLSGRPPPREIGTRLAVGARRQHILWQFLTEAMVLTLLGGVYYTKLGHYRPGTFADPAIVEASERFKEALEAIERAIEQANTVGFRKRYPYRHLLPSTIPQSINI